MSYGQPRPKQGNCCICLCLPFAVLFVPSIFILCAGASVSVSVSVSASVLVFGPSKLSSNAARLAEVLGIAQVDTTWVASNVALKCDSLQAVCACVYACGCDTHRCAVCHCVCVSALLPCLFSTSTRLPKVQPIYSLISLFVLFSLCLPLSLALCVSRSSWKLSTFCA